ncbi:hypothetical protein MY5147_002640 [Beauveria neobassiana]
MAAIARDSSKILGLVIGDCAIEPPGLYMPPRRSIPPPRRHEPATSAVRAPPGFDATRWMAPASGRQGEMGNWKRIRYGLDGWASKAGLGAIVAANYFTSE